MDNPPVYIDALKVGDVMRAWGVGEVVESKSQLFKKGDVVTGTLNWQQYALTQAEALRKLPPVKFPLYNWLGAAGVNGFTAYVGLINVGHLKKGETVLVSGAAGATGSVAGQIAKIYGCRVVGTAGSDEKCKFLKEECGFDAAINYRTSKNLTEDVSAVCPGGIDLFFDNVGGEILEVALRLIKQKARIILSGSISQYNSQNAVGPRNYHSLITKGASMIGFLASEYKSELQTTTEQLVQWINEGKIKATTQIEEGVEHAPDALLKLFSGDNTGKVVVKVG